MEETHLYRAGQFADRSGVTVRTLHHYDRLGLLRPSGRTGAGYRLYAESDFVQIEQIVALKFIGFSLREIRNIFNRKPLDLPAVLRIQRRIMDEKRRRLDLAIRAIKDAERIVKSANRKASSRGTRAETLNARREWEAIRKIIEVINMQQSSDFVKKYYTEEQLAELRTRWNPELQAKAERDWAALIQDAEAAVAAGEDPAGERSQALASAGRS